MHECLFEIMKSANKKDDSVFSLINDLLSLFKCKQKQTVLSKSQTKKVRYLWKKCDKSQIIDLSAFLIHVRYGFININRSVAIIIHLRRIFDGGFSGVRKLLPSDSCAPVTRSLLQGPMKRIKSLFSSYLWDVIQIGTNLGLGI